MKKMIFISITVLNIYNKIQVGVTSYGPKKCGSGKLPGVYTRLTHFYEWILLQTLDGSFCESPSWNSSDPPIFYRHDNNKFHNENTIDMNSETGIIKI